MTADTEWEQRSKKREVFSFIRFTYWIKAD